MEKEWHRIISFNGSQANAFEELVCQLAMAEESSEFRSYERVGTPDGGVECYWQLKDGKEWGWQAKYYENLGASEWNSIKQSLFDAIGTHPELSKYYICIPHNLSDARRGKKTQKSNWDTYRVAWTKELLKKKKKVELIFWNSSTLFSRLMMPANAGINYFFFQQIEIKEERLFLDLDAAIANLGPKYSPDLNFKLDYLPAAFDALSRNARFQDRFKAKLDKLMQELYEVTNLCSRFDETRSYKESLGKQCNSLVKLFGETDFSPMHSIPVEDYIRILKKTIRLTETLTSVYVQIESKYREEVKKKPPPENSSRGYDSNPDKTRRETDQIHEFDKAAEQMSTYLTGPVLRAANEGILFLKGHPGTGKSHSVADIALNRKQENIPSILLLGEHFGNQLPKLSLQQILSPNRPFEDYLKALESVAKAKQQRILFIIDAINEGHGKYIWKSSLAGLVKELQQYKWIGFAFTYRTTFEEVLIPENLNSPLLEHFGFEGIEYEATKSFFKFYKIQQPAVPILNPEFSNPLFLKTFCLTLNKAGKTIIPEGYEGISKILEQYLLAVNKNIGERLSFNHRRINLVQKSVDELVKCQIESGEQIIPWEKAFQLIEPLLKIYSNQTGLLEELIKEGLLIEDFYYNHDSGKYEEHGVVFNYERFNEHLKALFLIKKFNTVAGLKKAFAEKGTLRSYFVSRHGFTGINTGLLNALAIIIPETFGTELYEVFTVKDRYSDYHIYSSFIQSLIWRKHRSVKKTSWEYIRKHINNEEDQLLTFFNTIFLLAASPESFYNADFVHRLLKDRGVAERDHIWSIAIDKLWKWYERNSIKRIIDWSWSTEEKSYVSDESIVLLGKFLAWIFTNSNRKIRDMATKAFSALFTDRIYLLQGIIGEFAKVNDPYVLERVIAGSYGAVCHSKDLSASSTFAQFIYDEFFKHRKPPLNILTRDYLKGIIEFVTAKGGKVRHFKKNLYPPFDYSFPTEIPDDEWVKSLEIVKEGQFTDEERGQSRIFHSVLGWDFARYILGTNYGSSIPFTSYTITSRKSFENLKKQLRGTKREYLEMYVSAMNMLEGTSDLGKKIRQLYQGEKLVSQLQIANKAVQAAMEYFKKNLTSQQLKLLKGSKEFIKDGFASRSYEKKRFPVKLVQHYILKKVFDLGWKMDLFGKYDANVDEAHRRENKPERIGKKYQWIGYYEVMALLSDNYDFFDRHRSSDLPYLGTWQHHLRNIDPTHLMRHGNEKNEEEQKLPWWLKEHFTNWTEPRKTWLDRFDDMPNFEKIITLNDDQGEEWYLLYDRIVWESPRPIGRDRYNTDHKDVWIDIKGYLVKKKDKTRLLSKGGDELYWVGNEIPENPEAYNIFNAEWYFSDAYENTIQSSYKKNPFTKFSFKDGSVNIIHTTEEYGFSSGYDLSGEKSSTHKPSKFLLTLLDGQTGKNDSCIYDRTGQIIAMDAGRYMNELSNSLLVKKKVLDERLKKNKFEIVWIFCGEKEDIGAGISYVYRMLYSGIMGYVNGKFKMGYYRKVEK